MMRSSWAAVCAGLLLALGACDSGGGPVDISNAPPVVSDLVYSPDSLDLGTIADADHVEVDGDTLRLTAQVSARVVDPDDDLDRVRYVVLPPVRNADPVAEGSLPHQEGDTFAGTITIAMPLGQIGLYTVRVYADDRAGQLSNEVRGTLRVTGTGEPPVIEMVGPDTITRPASGTKRVALVATVSDADGLANVVAVHLWNVQQPNTRFRLFDDGLGDDAEASDGRYTITLEISSDNAPGVTRFAVQATDAFGLESDVFEKEITIE